MPGLLRQDAECPELRAGESGKESAGGVSMAKDGGNSLILLGGLAVAGYFAYEYFFSPTATTGTPSGSAPAGSGTYALPGGGTGTTPAAANLPGGNVGSTSGGSTGGVVIPTQGTGVATGAQTGGTAASRLDTTYSLLKAAAAPDQQFTGSGDGLTGLPYHWSFYLERVFPGTIPDVAGLFDVNTPVSAAAFWAVMAPALQAANPGLSGLGMFGGLGAFFAGRVA